jgi:hypothetical protein
MADTVENLEDESNTEAIAGQPTGIFHSDSHTSSAPDDYKYSGKVEETETPLDDGGGNNNSDAVHSPLDGSEILDTAVHASTGDNHSEVAGQENYNTDMEIPMVTNDPDSAVPAPVEDNNPEPAGRPLIVIE